MEKLIIDGPGNWVCDHILDSERTTIGRDRSNDIVLASQRVSSFHAVIVRAGEFTEIEDLNSTNGTFVNGQTVRKHALQSNDRIEIAGIALKYRRTGTVKRVGADFFLDHMPHAAQADREKTCLGIRDRLPSLPNPTENLPSVLESLVVAMGAHHGYIMLIDETEQKYVIKASHGLKEALHGDEMTYSQSVADTAVREGRTIFSRDAATDERFESATSVVNLGIHSVLCTPLRHENRVIGVIYLDVRSQDHIFQDADRTRLEDLARDMAQLLVAEATAVPAAGEDPRVPGPAPQAAPPSPSAEQYGELSVRVLREMDSEQAMMLALGQMLDRTGFPAGLVVVKESDGWHVYLRSQGPMPKSQRSEVVHLAAMDLLNRHHIQFTPREAKGHLSGGENLEYGMPSRLRILASSLIMNAGKPAGAVYTFQSTQDSVVATATDEVHRFADFLTTLVYN